jgi:molybdate transport system substrate-binding protein
MKDEMNVGQSKTYAFGKLALLCATNDIPCALDSLEQGKFAKLAIANPDIAPYGVASRQIIQVLGKEDFYLDKFVYGQNISQTMQFVVSGAVEAGFVAVSDLKKMNGKLPGQYVIIDPRFHDPIDQQLIVIKGKTNTADARYLAEFVLGPKGREIIKSFGYDHPNKQEENGS